VKGRKQRNFREINGIAKIGTNVTINCDNVHPCAIVTQAIMCWEERGGKERTNKKKDSLFQISYNISNSVMEEAGSLLLSLGYACIGGEHIIVRSFNDGDVVGQRGIDGEEICILEGKIVHFVSIIEWSARPIVILGSERFIYVCVDPFSSGIDVEFHVFQTPSAEYISSLTAKTVHDSPLGEKVAIVFGQKDGGLWTLQGKDVRYLSLSHIRTCTAHGLSSKRYDHITSTHIIHYKSQLHLLTVSLKGIIAMWKRNESIGSHSIEWNGMWSKDTCTLCPFISQFYQDSMGSILVVPALKGILTAMMDHIGNIVAVEHHQTESHPVIITSLVSDGNGGTNLLCGDAYGCITQYTLIKRAKSIEMGRRFRTGPTLKSFIIGFAECEEGPMVFDRLNYAGRVSTASELNGDDVTTS
jgi:hypothetical protein